MADNTCSITAVPQSPRDVMIIPSATAKDTHDIYQANRKFGKNQWAKYSPTERVTVDIAPTDTLESAIRAAAPLARLAPNANNETYPRRIILFVGHGGAAGERAQEVTSFDTVPEPGGFSTHKQKITKDTLQLGLDIDSGQVEVKDPDSPTPSFRSKGSPAWITDPAKTADLRKLQMLKRISAILNCYRVAQFIVLSCAAGSDPTLGPALSKVLNTRVGLYKQLVALGGLTYTTPGLPTWSGEQIWLAPLSCKTPQDVEKYRPPFNPDHSPKDPHSLYDYPEPEVFAPAF